MKSIVLAVLVVAVVATCLAQFPGPGTASAAMEKDSYSNSSYPNGCCKAGKQPVGKFCPRPGVECDCCTTPGNRNCYPVTEQTKTCKIETSCDLPGATPN